MNEISESDLIKSTANFSFELYGDSVIDARTLSRILDNSVSIMEALVRTEPETFARLNITKFESRSFDVYFTAIVEQAKTLFPDPKTAASVMITAFLSVFGIAKHLKGKRPQKIVSKKEHSEITNSDGFVYIADNRAVQEYFKNAHIEDCIIQITQSVDKSREDGFKIVSHSANEEITFSKDDMKNTTPVVPSILNEANSVLASAFIGELIIRKPDLMGDSKWGFVFDKHIEAAIEDKEWIERVHEERIAFKCGMRLPVKMRIEISLDKNGEPISGSEKYTIEEVTGDAKEPEKAPDQISFK
jgi:hypothetical protein